MALPHDMVAHHFAHQAGRNNRARGFNMYYDGDTLYSYGRHFPICRFVNRPDNGESVLMFTTRTASVSTAKHLSIARRAVSHLPKFYVDNVNAETDAEHETNAIEMERQFNERLLKMRSRRNPSYAEFDLADADDIHDAHRDYCLAFNIERPLFLVYPDDMTEVRANITTRRIARAEQTRIDREKLDAKAAEKYAELLPRWRAGEKVSLPYTGSGVYLLRIVGDIVETSGNARFTVGDAKAAFPLLTRLRGLVDAGKTLPALPDGRSIKVGHYVLNHITESGVRAGCHFIEWSEIDRVAAELGL